MVDSKATSQAAAQAAASRAALNDILLDIQRKHGHRTIHLANALVAEGALLPSGITALDTLLGGGFLRRKLNMLVSQPTSGAMSLVFNLIANAQKRDEVVVFIDMQAALDAPYAGQCGVDLKRLFIVTPETDTQALELVRDLAATNIVSLIILDGLADIRSLRRLRQSIAAFRTTLLLISQRPAEAAQLQLGVSCANWLYQHQHIIGCQIQARLLRHPNQASGSEVTFPLYFASGSDGDDD